MSSHPIRGKTIQWTFAGGPMAGMTFEHRFHVDGTVDYAMVGGESKGQPKKGPGVAYEVAKLNDTVYAVSYLGKEGYTLTTCLDLASGKLVAFSSNESELQQQTGTFEIIERGARASPSA